MDFKQRMAGLESAQVVAVTHLLFRYLTHRLDEPAFRTLFLAEGKSTEERERSYRVALEAIHDIEDGVGLKVEAFPASTLYAYIDELAEFSRKLKPARIDPVLRAKAELELQLLRSM